MTDLHPLHLEAFHIDLGAKFAPFAGYRMPIQYPLGVKGEHLHTRDAVGLILYRSDYSMSCCGAHPLVRLYVASAKSALLLVSSILSICCLLSCICRFQFLIPSPPL